LKNWQEEPTADQQYEYAIRSNSDVGKAVAGDELDHPLIS
jgi:hypothetical protein